MKRRVDPVTFEILRHRLWAINEEAATTIANVSGSPVASETYDFNVALLSADGDVVLIGPYVMAHAAALDEIVRYVQREFATNPGIGPGDMFITNDPYVGAMHQPDVALVAPIFDGDELIMWCASVVHQTDVGGPSAGSSTIGATSIYEEAIPLAPMRLVEAGEIRKDLEREYLIRSRMPGLNALDLRGQIAANRVLVTRVLELCARYGRDVLLSAVEQLIETTSERFQRRLRALPNGRWRHVAFVEHDGLTDAVYEVVLTMTHEDGRLVFDLTQSSEQAPALINCTTGTRRGYTLAAVITMLGYGLPWVPAAFWRSIEVETKPGSVVDAQWPAGVAMGNNVTGHAIRTAMTTCIAMMLDGSDSDHERAMASCMGTASLQMIGGQLQSGERFGTMLTDGVTGGMGARTFADGVDTGATINVPMASLANVETNELNYPMRYLWRRQWPDSGGVGRYRGGVGGEAAVVFDDVATLESTLISTGVEQSTSAGLSGGEPGAPNDSAIAHGASLDARGPDDLEGLWEFLPPKASLDLAPCDVVFNEYTGGGGYGDPLHRPPTEVAVDVANGLVSPVQARSAYFVILSVDPSGDVQVDERATAGLRADERTRRLGGRTPQPQNAPAPAAVRVSWALVLDGGMYACRHCSYELGSARRNVKDHLLVEEISVGARWPRRGNEPRGERFVLRYFSCPGCATRVETEINLRGRPTIWTLEPAIPGMKEVHGRD